MVIISKRSPDVLGWATEAAAHAPNVWAHQRAMEWWQKCCAVDQEVAKQVMAVSAEGWHWIASWPEAVAATVNDLYPEVFSDVTGESMLRFLASEAGRPYRVPGNRVVKAG